ATAQATVQPQQDVRDADDNPDVIVTAQKREQRIEDVPVTVTAVTGARMVDLGVNSLSEVAQYIPGLQIQEQSANNPGFVIR
ncbi:TonB-dependent receptor plug domain-containing protein, partial [Bacillus licheniformis]|uniref:TonB-dependent receptor plug domain-containing protein n=2 Tax=Bacteria TaxID=2 RepID=UPI003F6986AC